MLSLLSLQPLVAGLSAFAFAAVTSAVMSCPVLLCHLISTLEWLTLRTSPWLEFPWLPAMLRIQTPHPRVAVNRLWCLWQIPGSNGRRSLSMRTLSAFAESWMCRPARPTGNAPLSIVARRSSVTTTGRTQTLLR